MSFCKRKPSAICHPEGELQQASIVIDARGT
jgi:hypothetical protein